MPRSCTIPFGKEVVWGRLAGKRQARKMHVLSQLAKNQYSKVKMPSSLTWVLILKPWVSLSCYLCVRVQGAISSKALLDIDHNFHMPMVPMEVDRTD